MDSSDSRTPVGRFLGYHALGLFKSSQTAPLVFFHAAGPYRDGEGVPRNVEHARELLKKACEGGVENGCEKLQALQSSGM